MFIRYFIAVMVACTWCYVAQARVEKVPRLRVFSSPDGLAVVTIEFTEPARSAPSVTQVRMERIDRPAGQRVLLWSREMEQLPRCVFVHSEALVVLVDEWWNEDAPGPVVLLGPGGRLLREYSRAEFLGSYADRYDPRDTRCFREALVGATKKALVIELRDGPRLMVEISNGDISRLDTRTASASQERPD